MKNKIIAASKLFFSILIAQSAGIIGSFFTATSISGWYLELNKPSFNPPNYLFAPVWLTLYTLMGISAFLIWEKRKSFPSAKMALYLYLFHLLVNALWSIIFFGFKNISLAFVEIIFLWLLILVLIISFYRIRKVAAFLFVPYFLWVSFAAVLNYALMTLN